MMGDERKPQQQAPAKTRRTETTETEVEYASQDGDTMGNPPMRGDGTRMPADEHAERQERQPE